MSDYDRIYILYNVYVGDKLSWIINKIFFSISRVGVIIYTFHAEWKRKHEKKIYFYFQIFEFIFIVINETIKLDGSLTKSSHFFIN